MLENAVGLVPFISAPTSYELRRRRRGRRILESCLGLANPSYEALVHVASLCSYLVSLEIVWHIDVSYLFVIVNTNTRACAEISVSYVVHRLSTALEGDQNQREHGFLANHPYSMYV